MKNTSTGRKLSFQSKLENIAVGMEYYALSVPENISIALKTKKAVPVMAIVNGSEPFLASLYPVGGGRHYLRVRNKICKSVKIKKGDRVKVQIVVRDRTKEIAAPKDLMGALRSTGMLKGFKALPMGQKSFLLRMLDKAAKPETRVKRINEVIHASRKRLK